MVLGHGATEQLHVQCSSRKQAALAPFVRRTIKSFQSLAVSPQLLEEADLQFAEIPHN